MRTTNRLGAIPLTMDRNICAKLVSLDKIDGKKEVLLLEINKPVTIGRNPNLCTYVISDGYISNIHCKLYAVHTSTGGVMISCQVFLSDTPHLSVCKISEGSLDKWVYFERI